MMGTFVPAVNSLRGIFVPTIGGRLREERDRLGYTQTELADICGVKMRAQRNYEKDERHPDAEYLAAFSEAGGDVAYVITGQPMLAGTLARSIETTAGDLVKTQERATGELVAQQEIVPSRPSLAPDEELLLEAYRGMKPAKRKALLAEMLTGKKEKSSEGGIKVKGSGHRVAGRDFNEGKG